MAGIIIIISTLFLGFIVFNVTKTKMLKYVLTIVASLVYAFLLFFIGMGFGNIFYLIAAVPIIVGIIIFVRKK
jgi:hypothetical protein